jgi:hypothetical protein
MFIFISTFRYDWFVIFFRYAKVVGNLLVYFAHSLYRHRYPFP